MMMFVDMRAAHYFTWVRIKRYVCTLHYMGSYQAVAVGVSAFSN